MNKITLSGLIALLMLLLSSCNIDDPNVWITPTVDIQKQDLLGTWQTESGTITSTTSDNVLNDWIEQNNTLSFQEEDAFYRNFIGGTWALTGEYITLNPDADFDIASWTYQIISFSENELIVEIQLTESEYCCDFMEFEADEVLLITETYKRK